MLSMIIVHQDEGCRACEKMTGEGPGLLLTDRGTPPLLAEEIQVRIERKATSVHAGRLIQRKGEA